MFSELPIWIYIVYTLIVTHITIAAVTIYLHRHQTHRALDLHPVIAHFFRFWLWLTTGMITKEWVAIHRKHHARVESGEDPHSPKNHGIWKVLFDGVALYRKESFIPETLENYGFGTPDDWLEKYIYDGVLYSGIVLLMLINFALFGFIGITIWAIQIAWIPFFAAGVINGAGHWWGYRNFESPDASTNIVPFGLIIGGEELHNNHHAYASSAKFSNKWYEIDLGWVYIKVLQSLNLAKVKKLAPVPVIDNTKVAADLATVQTVMANRFYVMADYARHVMKDVYRQERLQATIAKRKLFRRSRRLLNRHESLLDQNARNQLDELLNYSESLNVAYEFREKLQQLWSERTANNDKLLKGLQEWCHQAEETGIESLRDFAIKLRSYDSVTA